MSLKHEPASVTTAERLVFHCQRTSASTAPCTSTRMCCNTHCARYCALCQPLLRSFSGLVKNCSSEVEIECRGRPLHPLPRQVTHENFVRTNVCDEHSGSTKITSHLFLEYCRRWRSNPSGKSSQERLTRSTVTSTHA